MPVGAATFTKIEDSSREMCPYRAGMSANVLVRRHALNVITAILFGVAVWRLGFVPELPAVLAFIFGGTLLAAIDWRAHRLPTELVYRTLAAVAVGLVIASVIDRDGWPLLTAIAGSALFANAFLLLHLVGKKLVGIVILGFGDVRLAALLGFVLGWYGLPSVLYGAVAGNVLALAMVAVMCVRRRSVQLQYAFGPPLIAGTMVVVLVHA